MNIELPRSLNLKSTINFVNALLGLVEDNEYIFDFKNVIWIEPFSLLYLSYAINVFIANHRESTIRAINFESSESLDYASHMGFFKAFGLDIGKKPGEARGNLNYLPIKIFNLDVWQEEAKIERNYIGEIIEKRSREFAQVLTRQKSGDLIDTLEFVLREIIRNVAEHSKASQLGFCAQYWSYRNLVELAILDTGIGFAASLSENPYLDKNMSDRDALNYALLPGISGKMYKGKLKDPYDVWENSGFGLYMASEICRNGGSFFVCTNTAGAIFRKTSKEYLRLRLPCTAIRLRLNTNLIAPTSEALPLYHKKGQRVAREIRGANISASTASTMLTRDFK